jgi:hypothetical protein
MKRKSLIPRHERKGVIKAKQQAEASSAPKPIHLAATHALVKRWRLSKNPDQEVIAELKKRRVLR